MKITNANFKKVSELYDFLNYIKTNLEEDFKLDQDYIDLNNLISNIEKLEQELDQYKEKVKKEKPSFIFDNNIIRIDITDGISFITKKYYIIKLTDCFIQERILCDILEITKGDYETSIVWKDSEAINTNNLIDQYNKFHHYEGEYLKDEIKKYKDLLKNINN